MTDKTWALIGLVALGCQVVAVAHEPRTNRPWRASTTMGLVVLISFVVLAVRTL